MTDKEKFLKLFNELKHRYEDDVDSEDVKYQLYEMSKECFRKYISLYTEELQKEIKIDRFITTEYDIDYSSQKTYERPYYDWHQCIKFSYDYIDHYGNLLSNLRCYPYICNYSEDNYIEISWIYNGEDSIEVAKINADMFTEKTFQEYKKEFERYRDYYIVNRINENMNDIEQLKKSIKHYRKLKRKYKIQ